MTFRDILMIWTGMIIYRLVHEWFRLKHNAGER